ncbi:hypothetical protein ABZS66_19990 [Dactylosporangium sp. NPDC005572]|uniref:hypothetical protein n=1 Tax=Dactylosporangium sp. NPDC005572 TaxID=3156889 RepID=UPI0033AE213D
MFWRIFGNRYGAVAIGVLLLVLVFSPWGSGGKALCGGVEMRTTDTCEETRNGKTTVSSYDEEKRSQSLARYGFMAAGFLLVLGGATMIVVRAVRKPAAA